MPPSARSVDQASETRDDRLGEATWPDAKQFVQMVSEDRGQLVGKLLPFLGEGEPGRSQVPRVYRSCETPHRLEALCVAAGAGSIDPDLVGQPDDR